MPSTTDINPGLTAEAINNRVNKMMNFLDYAEDVAAEQADHEDQEQLFVDVLFMPPKVILQHTQAPELYMAHVDELVDRLFIFGDDILTESTREDMLEPTQAEVLALCMVELTEEDLEGVTDNDAFTAFAIWLLRLVLDEYVEEGHAFFEMEMEDIFNSWNEDSRTSLLQMYNLLVEDTPREAFIDGRQYYLPSEIEDAPTNENLATFEGW